MTRFQGGWKKRILLRNLFIPNSPVVSRENFPRFVVHRNEIYGVARKWRVLLVDRQHSLRTTKAEAQKMEI